MMCNRQFRAVEPGSVKVQNRTQAAIADGL